MRRAALAVALLAAGCASGDPCEGTSGTCISVEVQGMVLIDQLRITASGAFTLADVATPQQPRETPVALPVRFALLPGEVGGVAMITLRAFHDRDLVGMAMQTVIVERGTHQNLTLTLNPTTDLGAPRDLAPPRDLARADLAKIVCDPVSQDPCPTTDKCLLATFNTGTCSPAGSTLPGGHCNADPDPCVRGAQCLLLDQNLDGQCTQFCSNDNDCDQPAVNVGSTVLLNNLPHCVFRAGSGPQICSVPCNPVAKVGPNGCPVGRNCNYSRIGVELTFCDGAGDGGANNPCDSNGSCQVGAVCTFDPVDGGSRCHAVCRANTNSDCEAGLSCFPGFGPQPTMFGVCCPPAGCG